MAYEVARVHGLIRSHIQESEKGPAEAWPLPSALPRYKYQMPRLSPDTPLLQDFPSEVNQWSESSHSSSLGSSTETETESDEDDDFIAGLAERIAHSMLDEEETVPTSNATAYSSGLTTSDAPVFPSGVTVSSQKQVVVSPRSSWSTNSWSASWSESVSSSKQSSEVSSPPSTPSTSRNDAWELLNEAAGEVGRLKVMEDQKHISYIPKQTKQAVGSVLNVPRQFVPPSQPPIHNYWKQPNASALPLLSSPVCNVGAPTAAPVVSKDCMPGGGPSHGNRSWNRPRDEDRKACSNVQAQHRVFRHDGVGWNQRQNRPNHPNKGVHQKAGRHNFGGNPRMGGKSVEWNGGQQWAGSQGVNGGSGMRAVFLGSAGSGRESGGTGVFLPRCIGGASDHRRKPACSTVLLPSRIVQVLNLNVEDMRSHPAPLPASGLHSRSEYARVQPPNMYMMELTPGASKPDTTPTTYPRKFQPPQVRQPSDLSAEFSLPTEWIY